MDTKLKNLDTVMSNIRRDLTKFFKNHEVEVAYFDRAYKRGEISGVLEENAIDDLIYDLNHFIQFHSEYNETFETYLINEE